MSRGRFIVLEGIDGSGTTTQAARLVASLRDAGHPVVGTREPSDGPMGLLLRQALTRRLVGVSDRVLALLFAADRLDHLASVVEPALAAGKVVVSDRYVLSSLAYQGMRLPLAWVEALNAAARPADLTLFLEVDVRTASRRRQARGGPVELFDADPVQRAVARAYGRVVRKHARAQRVVRLDGADTPDAVAHDIFSRARALLSGRRRQ
ncbi:MAG TPA: dTMP kinase [Myxococcaceae bacterium]|nr:dTMP kinase [Myxococcaceae bacterium]